VTELLHFDVSRLFPSSLARGAFVKWHSGFTETPGQYEIVYPNISWNSLRETQGWSALQHHSIIHTTVSIIPGDNPPPKALLVSVSQASYFALIPHRRTTVSGRELQWYTGNIYALPSKYHAIPLPSNLFSSDPTIFDLFISSDYEIRLFGDPLHSRGCPEPMSRVSLEAGLAFGGGLVLGKHHVYPDFLDGWALGDAMGVEVSSLSSWEEIEGAHCLSCDVSYYSQVTSASR
jgi:hypothetical protein